MTSEMSLADYWRIVKRRFGYIVVPLLAVMIGSHYYANSLPETFSTSAKVEIQKNTIRQGMGMQRAFVSPVEKTTLQQLTGSREVAQLAARELQKNEGSIYRNLDRKLLENEIRNMLSVRSQENSNILLICASGGNPVTITDYCNAYARAAIDYNDAERRKGIEELRDFITQQIKEYDARYVALEEKLMQMKGGVYAANSRITTGPDITSRADAIEQELNQLELNRVTMLAQKQALETAALRSDVDGIVAVLSTNSAGFQGQLAALTQKRNELASLLNRYTAMHPAVVKCRDELAGMEQNFSHQMQTAVQSTLSELDEKLAQTVSDHQKLMVERDLVMKAIDLLPNRMREERSVDRELKVTGSVLEMFRSRLDDLNLSLSTPADRMLLIEAAVKPNTPVAPNKRTIFSLGSAIGVLLGLALAFLIEAIDTSLTALRDVERVVGKPILAVIPKIRIAPEKYMEKAAPTVKKELLRNVPLLVDQRSPAAEAYRTLRAVLQSRFFDAGFKSLLVTSATPQEGKTTTIVNLSLACADAGLKTILVGANLRHPVLGRHFPIDRSRGLHELLLSRLPLNDAIQSTGYENLDIIDSGSFARRPAELLVRPEFDETLKQLKSRYDVILVDSPPTLPVADAATLASKVDGVLVVYLVSVSPRDALLRCRQTLEEVGGNIVGVVFNDVWGASQADYAGYYYYHKYASDEFSRL